MSIEPRHEFYETDEKVTISIFDKGANPEEVSVKFSSHILVYENGDKKLTLDPLTGEINPDASDFTVGKVKVEVRLAKKIPGRWVRLVKDSSSESEQSIPGRAAPVSSISAARKPQQRDWEAVSDNILKAEAGQDNTVGQDPNALDPNQAFAALFANMDDDAKRAMMKSYTESGGTTLSTDWASVSKGPVKVDPPAGQEWRQWG